MVHLDSRADSFEKENVYVQEQIDSLNEVSPEFYRY